MSIVHSDKYGNEVIFQHPIGDSPMVYNARLPEGALCIRRSDGYNRGNATPAISCFCMQSENVLRSDLPAVDVRPEKSRKSSTNLWISIHAVAFLLGFAVLAFVVYKIGYQSIIDSVTHIGWGLLIIIALNVTRHFARAGSMFLAVEPEHRTFKYRSAIAARLGGEAVNFFTFTGPFLGDATKAVLLRKNLPLTYGASAIIIDNILYYVSVILMILSGVAIFLFTFGSTGSLMNNVLLAVVLASVAMFAGMSLAILYRVTPVTQTIDFFARRGFAPKFVQKLRQNILDVETNVFHFYHNRRGDFFKMFSISLSVHLFSVAEVFLALKFLGYDAFVSTAFIIESLTKVINAAFSFVPGTIGVYEGGNGIILQSLGYTAGVGVALALVRRGAILFSTFLGLMILLWRTAERGAKHLAKPVEE